MTSPGAAGTHRFFYEGGCDLLHTPRAIECATLPGHYRPFAGRAPLWTYEMPRGSQPMALLC